MILSQKQKRIVRERIQEKYPDHLIVGLKSIKKSYTDSKVKITLQDRSGREVITYIDMVFLKDIKGNPIV